MGRVTSFYVLPEGGLRAFVRTHLEAFTAWLLSDDVQRSQATSPWGHEALGPLGRWSRDEENDFDVETLRGMEDLLVQLLYDYPEWAEPVEWLEPVSPVESLEAGFRVLAQGTDRREKPALALLLRRILFGSSILPAPRFSPWADASVFGSIGWMEPGQLEAARRQLEGVEVGPDPVAKQAQARLEHAIDACLGRERGLLVLAALIV